MVKRFACVAMVPAALLLAASTGCKPAEETVPASPPVDPDRAKVLVAWTTQSAEGLYGFNVFRGPSADGPWTRVNPTPILAAEGGTSSIPHDYEYVDKDEKIRIGQTYWYWLEAVDNDGRKRKAWPTPKSVVAKTRLNEPFLSQKNK